MRLIRFACMLLLLLAPTISTAQDAPPPVRERDNVYRFSDEDAAFNAAIARARATLPVFHRYLEQVGQDEVHEVKLKAEFRQGEVVEHMWIANVAYDGRVYRGVLESRPVELTNVGHGDVVTVRPDRVSDWMVIVGDDVMLGNFTAMELRRRMSSKERSQLDRMMGYRILADSAILALPRP